MESNMKIKKHLFLLWIALLFEGCSDSSSSSLPSERLRGEYLFRLQGETFAKIEPIRDVKRPFYPWEEERSCKYSKITKEFFRCRGSQLNPAQLLKRGKEVEYFYDCGGSRRHSLPLRDGKEFIYPILVHLLNHIQTKLGRQVVITCGHCCPDHHVYLDPSSTKKGYKHMIGAEVDFYVRGMEQNPEGVVEVVLAYYKEQKKYKGLKEFEEFKSLEKNEGAHLTSSWHNKEISLQIVGKSEGRDFDNRHPYPYICVQVRYDWDSKNNVTYSWEKAFRGFHRW